MEIKVASASFILLNKYCAKTLKVCTPYITVPDFLTARKENPKSQLLNTKNIYAWIKVGFLAQEMFILKLFFIPPKHLLISNYLDQIPEFFFS